MGETSCPLTLPSGLRTAAPVPRWAESRSIFCCTTHLMSDAEPTEKYCLHRKRGRRYLPLAWELNFIKSQGELRTQVLASPAGWPT